MAWIIKQMVDLTRGDRAGQKQQFIQSLAYPGNENAHRWEVTVLRNGLTFPLSGYAASAEFDRPDGNRVASVSHGVSDNMAWVEFPADVYAVEGMVNARLSLSKSGEDAVLAAITFRVSHKSGGPIIDPGGVIALDVAALIAEIEEVRSEIPRNYARLVNEVDQLMDLNAQNLLIRLNFPEGTQGGVTCTYNGNGSYTLVGTAGSSSVYFDLWTVDANPPYFFNLGLGLTYRAWIDSTNIKLRFAWYDSSNVLISENVSSGTDIFDVPVPVETAHMRVSLVVPASATVNDTVYPYCLSTLTNYELTDRVKAVEAVAAGAVRYDAAQTMTDAQKAQGRENIGAANDADVSELKSAFVNDTEQITGNKPLVFQKGQYRVYNDNTVSDLTTPVTDTETSQKMVCAKCPCIPGDVFTVKARGKGTSAGAIGFFDADFKGIYRTGTNTLYDDTIEAPANAAWFAVNHDIVEYPDIEYYAYKGDALVNRVAAVEGMLPGAPFVYLGTLKSTDDLNALNVKGWYMWTSSNSPIHAPYSGSAGKLLVFSNGLTSIVQVFLSVNSDSPIRYRVGNSNGFSTWYTIANTSDVQTLEQTVSAFRADFSGNGVMALIEAHKDGNDTYTETFSFDLDLPANPRVLSIVAKYTGDAPTIQIVSKNPTSGVANLTSPIYELGSAVEMTRRSWRIPAAHSVINKATVTITIPTGTVVSIREATLHDDQRNRYGHPGILFHGHRGSIAPSDTIVAFQIGAELGYNSMITIPKFTADDVGICFHDDTEISGGLQWMDGSAITGSDDKAISEYTYAEITQNFKIKSSLWGELHVPTIDDYFRVCSLTGMKPIFSIHSSPSGMFTGTTGTAHFETIKTLAKKWNVLDGIGIKSGSDSIMGCARGVFGTAARYIWISGQTHAPYNIFSLSKNAGFVDSQATDLTGCEYDLTSEYFYSQTVTGATYYTETMASMADLLSKGYKLSIADASPYMTGAAMKGLIALGVTEFTVDRHISMGLDW